MKHLIAILIAISVLVASTTDAKTKRVELKPKDASNGIAVVNLGKTRTYYPLSSRRSTIVDVKGPGELRILTRARFAPKAKDELDYRIIYKVDGSVEHLLDVVRVTRSQDAKYKDGALGNPAESKDLKIKIGRGYHTIELMLPDSLPRVSARYLFAPRKQKKTRWIALSPLTPVDPVDLLAGEATSHYYRFSAEKPLKIEIIGPTELRILSRVENSFDMKGRAHYRLQIKQKGQVVQSFQLSSSRSETATYKNSSKLVPGKAREVVYNVPKGKQQYEIVPLDKRTLLGLIMFPQKDAKLGL